MAVNGGAGNAISLGEIQAFYGGSNPISLSEYNRGGCLVPSSFAGSATATTGTTSQTVDDFGVTVTTLATGYTSFSTTITQGNSGFSGGQASGNWNVIRENAGSGTGTWTARVLNAATTLSGSCDGKALTVTKNGTGEVSLGNSGGSWSVSCSPGDVLVWTCSAGIGGGGTINRSQSWAWSGSPTIQYTANTNGGTSGSVSAYKVVFANNTSTSDTYTLTSGSTGSETVYSPGESQNVRNNDSSNSWVIAYDNITGSGSGTAGDISVTVADNSVYYTYGSQTAGSWSSGSGGSTQAIPGGVSRVRNVTFNNSQSNNNTYVILYDSGSNVLASASGSSPLTIAGPVDGVASIAWNNANDDGDARGHSGGSYTYENRTSNPKKKITFTNNGSSSLTLGSSSTGGARVIAASASHDVQTGNTNNQSWAVYFDTSSGNCNTNVPTSISSGNAANFDIFNAPGTPVG